uniref:Small ribosomal subunit protein uS2c n=1 Tax=Prasinoderma coloniale TaxID=156133 RepID=A0A088CIA6_9VIRI|nr:ribosomal protein S2 [Prasinoderma coloniale]AID67565.1 ribosomal protein S2 [Prasinoderma coloniale]
MVQQEQNMLFDMVYAGVHLGHRANAWNPKMEQYIYKKERNIHVIDVVQTMVLLKKACQFTFKQAAQGNSILIVGTKTHLVESIMFEATRCQALYVVNRWLGGLLTNQQTIRSRISKLSVLEKDQNNTTLTKKELMKQRRELDKLRRNFDGLRNLDKMPSCAIIIDPVKEKNALAECKRLNIPVVAFIDTNGDPSGIEYPIPTNDDSVVSVQYLLRILVESVCDGIRVRLANQLQGQKR